MLPASSNAAGTCIASAPDVCKTPSAAGPVPIPYPNIAQCATATGFDTNVTFTKRNALNKLSKAPMSSADEAGVAGGVKSSMNMNEVSYTLGSAKVSVGGQQVVYHTSMTGQNGANFNITGNQPVPSQTNVMVSP